MRVSFTFFGLALALTSISSAPVLLNKLGLLKHHLLGLLAPPSPPTHAPVPRPVRPPFNPQQQQQVENFQHQMELLLQDHQEVQEAKQETQKLPGMNLGAWLPVPAPVFNTLEEEQEDGLFREDVLGR